MAPDPGAPEANSLAGMDFYQHPYARDWDTCHQNLRSLLGSLAADLPALHPYATGVAWVIAPAGESSHHAQGWIFNDECHLETGDTPVATRTNNGLPGIDLSPTLEHGCQVADQAYEVIRGWGLDSPRQLRYEAWANNQPQRLWAAGFGLAAQGDHSQDLLDDGLS